MLVIIDQNYGTKHFKMMRFFNCCFRKHVYSLEAFCLIEYCLVAIIDLLRQNIFWRSNNSLFYVLKMHSNCGFKPGVSTLIRFAKHRLGLVPSTLLIGLFVLLNIKLNVLCYNAL